MKPSAILLFVASLGLGSAASISEPTTSNIQKRACFQSGAEFGYERDKAYNTIAKACADYFTGTYPKGKDYRKCYNLSSSKSIELVIGLKGKHATATRWLGVQECKNGFYSEVDSCSKGGQTTYGNWYYRVDPNLGTCK